MEKWYAAQPEEAHGWWVVSRDPEGHDCIDASGDGGFNEPEARLIAAAPEMLEALKAFLAYDEQDGESDVEMMLAYGEARDMARAAIAKAEGQS